MNLLELSCNRKSRRGPARPKTNHLRTARVLHEIEICCPSLLKLLPRENVWKWRNGKVSIPPHTLSLIRDKISRAPALGGKNTARQIEAAYYFDPTLDRFDVCFWDAFGPDGHHVPVAAADQLGNPHRWMNCWESAKYCLDLPGADPLLSLAACTGAVFHHYYRSSAEEYRPTDPGPFDLFIQSISISAPALAKLGISTTLFAEVVGAEITRQLPDTAFITGSIFARIAQTQSAHVS